VAKGFAPSFSAVSVQTAPELRNAIKNAVENTSRGHFIEVKIPEADFPNLLRAWTSN
jgi:TPP-dependent 2-oxoacid decarboxylase